MAWNQPYATWARRCAEVPKLYRLDELIASQQADQPGAYILVGSMAIPVLHAAGYYSKTSACHRFLGFDAVVYVGSAAKTSVKKRVADHLFGDSRKSTMRQSLGLLLSANLKLVPQARSGNGGFHFGDGERVLTDWISANLKAAFVSSNRAIDLERQLQHDLSPALNIKEREWDPFARFLSSLRQAAVPNN